MRPSDRLRIGLAQTDAELGNVPANVARVVDLVHSARRRVDVLVLPELALTGYSVGSRFYDLSLRTDDPLFQQLLDAADETMTLVVGFVEEDRRLSVLQQPRVHPRPPADPHTSQDLHLGQIREARTVVHTLRDDDLSFLQRRIEKIMVRHHV